MKHETFLNIIDFIADLDIQIGLLEHSIDIYNLNVPNYIKKSILSEIENDKKIILRKKMVREHFVQYLRNKGVNLDE